MKMSIESNIFIACYPNRNTFATPWETRFAQCKISIEGLLRESSKTIQLRVQAARDIQNNRFSLNGSLDIICNADMSVGAIRQFCKLQDECQSLMRAAMSQMNLSARAYHQHSEASAAIADLVGVKKSNPRIWQVHYSSVRSWWRDHCQYCSMTFFSQMSNLLINFIIC